MALEELIVAWSKERPAWQREVMRRVAAGDMFSDREYVRLVDDIVAGKQFPEPKFGLEQLPQAAPEDSQIRLVAIEKFEHVNALESRDPLTFEPRGLTIVYGDNGSGKSGYARLLKRITRARHQEEVLTDVFRDTSLAKPTAVVSVRIDDSEESLDWPESSRPELQRMRFYDVECGNAYISSESDFPYRPSALFVMDGLIEACVAVRTLIDAKLVENHAAGKALPSVPEEARATEAGKFLASITGSASPQTLDALIASFDASTETIDELKAQETRLRSADTSRERQQLIRQSEKIEALCDHLQALDKVLGNEALTTLRQHRVGVEALEDAAALLARSFESEPLAGIGGSPWKALWETARRFSEQDAYPGQAFPVLGSERRCVLCLQNLEEEARERFQRFDRFVKDETQVQLREARSVYDREVTSLVDLAVLPQAVANNLKDLESTHPALVVETRELVSKYETALEQNRAWLASQGETPEPAIDSKATITNLTRASVSAKMTVAQLANPEGIQRQLAAVTGRTAELELLEQVKSSRQDIVEEIARLKKREALDVAKSAAATTGITKKILELSEEGITEVVRDTFTRETDRLRLERVTIARTRADRGALLHQPKLVGARQQVTLPRVFSEGEQTALGLAAFFTEAHLDASNSALILDDPVTSLDHIRRGLVAARLAALADTRQVIVFTHDVSFVADLKREANGKGVPFAERSVTRNRADDRKPGACSTTHPWKAKDVPARLDELRREIARMKKDSGGWDQKTYEDAVAVWSGNVSETWERIFSQEIVGPVLAEGGLEVRPMMVKILARFSDTDRTEFEASYSRVSQWAKRHDKSALVNYVAPDVADLETELAGVDVWFKRVKGYKA